MRLWDFSSGGFEYEGEWSPLVQYQEGQVVSRTNGLYIANSKPPIGADPSAGSPWDLMVQGV